MRRNEGPLGETEGGEGEKERAVRMARTALRVRPENGTAYLAAAVPCFF